MSTCKSRLRFLIAKVGMMESDILEAVHRLVQAEDELRTRRSELGEVLIEAHRAYNVTDLSRITGMNRPRIYWLMEKRRNEDRDRDN